MWDDGGGMSDTGWKGEMRDSVREERWGYRRGAYWICQIVYCTVDTVLF